MEWETRYIEEDGIIATTTHGIATLESIKMLAANLVYLGKQHGSHKFINDNRNISHRLSTIEIHNLPQTLLDIGHSRLDRVAIVYSANSAEAPNFIFFDARCHNSSMNIRAFTDYDEAYRWLLQ